jgi:carbon-monoxide dehydrogenase medium subunit
VDVATAGASVLIQLNEGRFEEVRIALNSVGPIPFRARNAERILKGEMPGKKGLIEEAAQAASEESSPIEDIRGDVARRRKLVEILVRDAVRYILAA